MPRDSRWPVPDRLAQPSTSPPPACLRHDDNIWGMQWFTQNAKTILLPIIRTS